MDMKNTARTGLALERDLYLLAQKKAAADGRSFADYVVSLIAHDLIDHPEGHTSARIRQMRDDRARFLNPVKAWERTEAEDADAKEARRDVRSLAHKVDPATPRPRKPKAA